MESPGSIRRQSVTQHPLKELDSPSNNTPQEGKNGVKSHDPQTRSIPEGKPSPSSTPSLKDRAITKPDSDDVASTRPPVENAAEGSSDARAVSAVDAKEIVAKLTPLYQKLAAPEQAVVKKRSLKKRAASFIKSVKASLKKSKSVPDLSKTRELTDTKNPNTLTRSQSAPELSTSPQSPANTPYGREENPLKPVIEQLEPLLEKTTAHLNKMHEVINTSTDKTTRVRAKKAIPDLTTTKLQIEQSLYSLHTLTPSNRAEQELQLINTPKQHQQALDKALKHLPQRLQALELAPAARVSIEGDDEYTTSAPATRPPLSEQETSFSIPPAGTKPVSQPDRALVKLARNNSHLEGTRATLEGQIEDIDRKLEELHRLVNTSKNKKNAKLANKAIESLESIKGRVEISLAAANEATPNASASLMTKLVSEPRAHQRQVDKAMLGVNKQLDNIPNFRPVTPQELMGRMESLEQLDDQLSNLQESVERLTLQHQIKTKEGNAARKLLSSSHLQELNSQINLAKAHLTSGDSVNWKQLTKALNQVNKQIAKSKLYNTPAALNSVLLVPPAK